MDTSALIQALRQGDMVRFVELFRGYADQYEEIVWEGQKGIVSRVGMTELGVTPDNMLHIHTHEDVDGAARCHDVKIAGIRQMLVMAEQIQRHMNGEPNNSDNPLVGVTVPDDLRGLLG